MRKPMRKRMMLASVASLAAGGLRRDGGGEWEGEADEADEEDEEDEEYRERALERPGRVDMLDRGYPR